MKLNNKGFTLIEVLAVVIILAILISITAPSITYIINKNKENNYNDLKKGIISAAKVYVSDNRYNLTLDYTDNGGLCSGSEEDEDIAIIAGKDLKTLLGISKLPISLLVDAKDLTTNSDGKIINPLNESEFLDLTTSYVLVKYQCSSKDYKYTLEADSLNWK